jgi:hypothetical protein
VWLRVQLQPDSSSATLLLGQQSEITECFSMRLCDLALLKLQAHVQQRPVGNLCVVADTPCCLSTAYTSTTMSTCCGNQHLLA